MGEEEAQGDAVAVSYTHSGLRNEFLHPDYQGHWLE